MPKEIRQEVMPQREFLLDAMERLGLTKEEMAVRLGCPWNTFKKWIAAPDAKDNYREMPPIAWAFVREVLAHEQLKTAIAEGMKKVTKAA